jgi:hypothetical protein
MPPLLTVARSEYDHESQFVARQALPERHDHARATFVRGKTGSFTLDGTAFIPKRGKGSFTNQFRPEACAGRTYPRKSRLLLTAAILRLTDCSS